ncbi:MAG TPA: LysE family transporter [Candidatus Kapabacteria bacterium]|nr:LysE family transporter [Candidatus Kapabacteria bacterium]HET6402527.1 LysE family transporter [Candidatus Kapabacteria bacterium]
MIIALLIGAITGWLMSMPIGPVNAAAISRTLKHGFKIGLAVGAGAAMMDVIYCGGAAQINQFLVESPVINLFFELAGFMALLYLGIHQLRTKLPGENRSDEGDGLDRGRSTGKRVIERLKEKNIAEPFVIGIVLYATNVMAVPEWIIISGLWRSWGVLGSGFTMNAFFALGAGVGTFGWFSVLVGWIVRHHRGFQPSTIRKINIGTSVAMLVFSGYFAYAIIFETHWPEVSSHFKENTGRIIDSLKR